MNFDKNYVIRTAMDVWVWLVLVWSGSDLGTFCSELTA